jgi:magnesium transporter
MAIADHLESLPHQNLTEETYVAILDALANEPRSLGRLLADLHPADIADLLERLPRSDRGTVLGHIPYEHLGDVVAELEEGVQEHVLKLLRPEEVRHAIAELESDDAADMAQMVEDITDESGPEAAELIDDRKAKTLLGYDDNTAGAMMQVEVMTALATRSVSDVLAFLREHAEEMPNHPGSVFVVDTRRKLLGSISLHRLVKSPLEANLTSVMRKDPLTVTPETPVREVIQIFEKYDLHTLPVVSPRMELLGRIMIDDVLDAVQATAAHRQAAAAGVDESEDLFAPPTETVRHRLPWLGINLLTAVAASAVIALFETSIAQLTTLAILMPIVASMGGNATTQTQTVIIRGLALGQITKQNAFALLKKEFMAGGYLGTILALVMAVAVGLLYSNWMLALVIGMATIANHLIAALGGWVTPLILRKYNYDPAIATGVITTTFTDVGGFFVFLGLASILLL